MDGLASGAGVNSWSYGIRRGGDREPPAPNRPPRSQALPGNEGEARGTPSTEKLRPGGAAGINAGEPRRAAERASTTPETTHVRPGIGAGGAARARPGRLAALRLPRPQRARPPRRRHPRGRPLHPPVVLLRPRPGRGEEARPP